MKANKRTSTKEWCKIFAFLSDTKISELEKFDETEKTNKNKEK